MPNKVKFGISNLHFGSYTVDEYGVAHLGAPFHLPGTVTLSLEPSSDFQRMYADNGVYWSGYSDDGYDGEIENALFTDAFKCAFLGYEMIASGGCAQIRGAERVPVYLAFESDGDQEKRRGIIYNIDLGRITRDHSTTEDSIEPGAATLPFTVHGDLNTNCVRASYGPEDSAYAQMFTSPPAPIDLTYFEIQDETDEALLDEHNEAITGHVPLDKMLEIQRESPGPDRMLNTFGRNLISGLGRSTTGIDGMDRNTLAAEPQTGADPEGTPDESEINAVLNDTDGIDPTGAYDEVHDADEENLLGQDQEDIITE